MIRGEKFDKLLSVIADVSSLSIDDIKGRKRSGTICTARGVLYVMAIQNGISRINISKFMNRARCNVSITSSRYFAYLKVGDNKTCSLYNKAKEKLNEQ